MTKSKIFLLVLGLALTFSACNSGNKYGDKSINTEGAIDASEVIQMLEGKDSVEVKLKGVVSAVCQKKGCWMTMPIGEDETMSVRFKDYGFFVPMNAADREAVVEGYAFIDTLTVAEQKHYASDANKSEEEIAAITEPLVEYSFLASGVILK